MQHRFRYFDISLEVTRLAEMMYVHHPNHCDLFEQNRAAALTERRQLAA